MADKKEKYFCFLRGECTLKWCWNSRQMNIRSQDSVCCRVFRGKLLPLASSFSLTKNTGGNGGVGVVRSGSAGGVTLSLSLTALDGAEPRDYYSWYAAIDSDRTYHMRVKEYKCNTILPALNNAGPDAGADDGAGLPFLFGGETERERKGMYSIYSR